MSATVEVKVHAPSGTIVLNRPDKRNALSRSMLSEFMTALSDLHQEARVRSVIVTGSGSSFCAGLDLHEMHETSQS
ncbi:MAG TPA: enoyl-CoA hydratase/isomerase family protein, partial [Planctomycetaceae bacterium]|nr:enoyl-CoA hydratase/isomerase family protein [Planctomycetaceae bacterium]